MGLSTIRLTGLRVRGMHGVLDFEHAEAQDFVVDVALHLDISRAIATDDVAHTINYAEVADMVVGVIEGDHADLIETLAGRIAERALGFGAAGVEVTVHKPQAPIPHEFTDVSVTLERWALEAGSAGDGLAAGLAVAPGAGAAAQAGGQLSAPAGAERAVIGVGSNLDAAGHVRAAIEELGELGVVVAASGLYDTAPRLAEGQAGQPDYVNAVVLLDTHLSPLELLDALQGIEAAHGRVRSERWGARTLDLDIVTYAGLELDTPRLTLPHPRAAERRFVLEPWAAVDPGARLAGHPVVSLLAGVADQRVQPLGEPA